MMSNKVPQVRFKGFIEEWDGIEFYKSFTNIPNNSLSRAELNYEHGLAKNIHYGDVLIKFAELLDIEKEEVPFINNADFINKIKVARLQNGDMIISDAAEDKMVGKCTEIVNIRDEIVFSGLHTIAVRPIKTFASKYLGYYMNSSSYHNQLLPLLQGTKVLSISKSSIKNTEIYSPKDVREQTKIGNYFQQLDKLIEQKEKKHQKLKQFKKAMLDKMFPKNGADTPEIRFKGFSGKWEEKRLGEICKLITKGTTPLDKSSAGTINYIKVENINNSSGKINITSKITEEEHLNYLKRSQLQENDILFSIAGTLGRVTTVSKDLLPVNTNQALAIIRLNQGILGYITTYLKGNTVNRYIKENPTIGAQPNLSLGQIENIQLLLPKEKEQEKIGNYFQKLDNQIDLQKKELEKLKNIKKASLDKMFV